MSRYIDADRLRKDILGLPNCYNGFSDTYDKALIIDRIDEQPTADVVEVVRCKDCKHYISDGGALMICEITEMNTNDCDYCSYGERKDEGL